MPLIYDDYYLRNVAYSPLFGSWVVDLDFGLFGGPFLPVDTYFKIFVLKFLKFMSKNASSCSSIWSYDSFKSNETG